MREDGTMMRTAELAKLAERFQIKFITIRDLQEYRKCHDKLVDQVTAVNLPTKYGTFRAYGFVSRLNGEHHIALVKGDIGDGKDILCRVHSECLTGDTFGSLRCDCGQQLAMCWDPSSPISPPVTTTSPLPSAALWLQPAVQLSCAM